MSQPTVVRRLRATVVCGGILAVSGSVVIIVVGGIQSWYSSYLAFMTLLSLFFAFFGWLVIPGQAKNPVVWTMVASAFFAGLFVAGRAVAVQFVVSNPELALRATPMPADLPAGANWVLVFTEHAWAGGLIPLMTFGLLLFPDGRLPSRRWRWVGAIAIIALALATLGTAWSYRPGGEGSETSVPVDLGLGFFVIASALSVVAMVRRLRRSSGATRAQFKWIVWGATIFVPSLIISILTGATNYENLGLILVMAGEVVFIVSYGIAVGRYRLFEIDLVIRRTVVAAGLAGFITLVYAAGVVVVSVLLRDVTDAALPLAIAAAVIVAIAFQPVRNKMRRWADRLVYGDRATPYEVLSEISERMRDGMAAEHLIPRMAQLLTEGTGAVKAAVWMTNGKNLEPVAAWPDDHSLSPELLSTGENPLIPGAGHVVSVDHDGEVLGALSLWLVAGETLNSTEIRLVDDLASQAGLIFHNARLTMDKERKARERERIDHELRVASFIQQTLLPQKLPVVDGWSLDAFYRPALEVGGDFYDFLHVDRDLLGLVIGDVTDKGVPAALVMATCRSTLRAAAAGNRDPGTVLAHVNQVLVEEIPSTMFVTCLYGILDTRTGSLTYANAGHNLPYVRSEDGVVELRATGMPLGIFPESVYEIKKTVLATGESMLLSSDGIVEAHDSNGEMYGFPRLISQMYAHGGREDLLSEIVADLERFSGPDHDQEDDITLVVVKRTASISS